MFVNHYAWRLTCKWFTWIASQQLLLLSIMFDILPYYQVGGGMASLCVCFGLVTLSHAYGEYNLFLIVWDTFNLAVL